MIIKTRPKKENLEELTKWFKKRDYSVLIGMPVGEFIIELEERLALYWDAELLDGNCFTDPRWLKIYLRNSIIINDSSLYGRGISETSGISVVRKEHLPLLIDAYGSKQNKQAVTSPSTDKQDCTEYSEEAEKFQQQMAEEKEKIDFDEYMPDTLEESTARAEDQMAKFKEQLAKKHQKIAEKNLEPYSDKQKLAAQNAAKDDYLLSIGSDEQKLVLNIDVKNFNKKELMEQFNYILSDAFKTLGIEDAQTTLKTGTFKSLDSFLSNYAVQYLDLLIYCLIKPKTIKDTEYVWQIEDNKETEQAKLERLRLTEKEIAELFNKHELDVVDITRMKKDCYTPKLLDQDYMERFIDNIKSEPTNLKERVNFKKKRKVNS